MRVLRVLLLHAALAVAVLQSAAAADSDDRFRDPLNTAAEPVRGAIKIEHQPFLAITHAGKRLVAVGLRGVIALSDDEGTRPMFPFSLT
jgi:photosystem II stability/assembly factor-like uncharacterized protein